MKTKRIWSGTIARTRMVSARLPLALADQLKDYAARHGESMTNIVSLAVIEYLEQNDDENLGKEDGGYFLY